MNNKRRIASIEERREFVQEIIDRLLYLDTDSREKFIDSMQGAMRKFKPEMAIMSDGETRVYKSIG
jgi:hypothetical protein